MDEGDIISRPAVTLRPLALMFFMSVVVSPSAIAQEDRGPYAFGGVTFATDTGSTHSIQRSSGTQIGPAIPMIGVPVGAGMNLGSFSLEAEYLFGKTAHYEGVRPCQSLDPSRCVRTVEINRRHDRVMTFATRFHLRTRPVHFEPVFGAVLARTRWSHSSSAGGELLTERDYGWRTGGMGGMEARIGSQRFAFVPSLRLQFMEDKDAYTVRFSGTDTTLRSGSVLPRWSLRAGVTARAEF